MRALHRLQQLDLKKKKKLFKSYFHTHRTGKYSCQYSVNMTIYTVIYTQHHSAFYDTQSASNRIYVLGLESDSQRREH